MFCSLFLCLLSNAGLFLLFLLVVCDLFQPEEVLSCFLIKFRVNPRDDTRNLWNLDELQRVHTSVCHLQRMVQSDELRLEGCDIHQDLQEAAERLSSALDSLTTTVQTHQLRAFIHNIVVPQRKDWQLDTCHVVSAHSQLHISATLLLRARDLLHDVALNIASSKEGCGKADLGFFELITHTDL